MRAGRPLRPLTSISALPTLASDRTDPPIVAQTPAILFAPNGVELPAPLGAWVQRLGAPLLRLTDAEELMGLALRGRPRLVIIDARTDASRSLDVCRRLKEDSYTGVVPCVVICDAGLTAVADAFAAGADEVIGTRLPED